MSVWFSPQSRLLVLIIGTAILWTIESLLPLYRYEKHRLRRALPNIAFTVLLILTNLLLSFVTACVANFVMDKRIGVFFLFDMPSVLPALFGVMALDLFTYFAHLLMHKSWLGWQFHRVHHSDPEVNVTTAFRQHPGETLWRILWQLLAVATFGLPLSVVVVYSNIFSIWDRIFGTYTATVDFSRLRYGLDGFDDRKKQTLPALLKLPFLHET